jgi:hypothetical protein
LSISKDIRNPALKQILARVQRRKQRDWRIPWKKRNIAWVASEGCACQGVSRLQISQMSAKTPEEGSQPDEKPVENTPAEFEVEEAGEESFPASDPPAWTSGRGSEDEDSEPEKE